MSPLGVPGGAGHPLFPSNILFGTPSYRRILILALWHQPSQTLHWHVLTPHFPSPAPTLIFLWRRPCLEQVPCNYSRSHSAEVVKFGGKVVGPLAVIEPETRGLFGSASRAFSQADARPFKSLTSSSQRSRSVGERRSESKSECVRTCVPACVCVTNTNRSPVKACIMPAPFVVHIWLASH